MYMYPSDILKIASTIRQDIRFLDIFEKLMESYNLQKSSNKNDEIFVNISQEELKKCLAYLKYSIEKQKKDLLELDAVLKRGKKLFLVG